MAHVSLSKYARILVFWGLFAALHGFSTPETIPLRSVSDLLIQSALNSLNDDSPTHHTYKSGNLISAQKLLEPPYVIYRLTLNLEPNCKEDTACPREACAIDLRQHELGVIDVQKDSIQCMYLYPQTIQDEIQQQQILENAQDTKNVQQEQENTENSDRHTANESVQLDHEVQTVTDGNDRPFIAVRATDRNYCAGCPYELNPTLPGLGAFGEQVVQSMDESLRSDFKYKVVSIVRVTRAVPPGSNVVQYEILLEIGETNCLKTSLIKRTECSLLTNIPIHLCLVTFEERPWQQNSRKMTRNNCTEVPESANELNGSVEPYLTSEALVTSDHADEESTSGIEERTELYDQIAQEGKLGGYGSSIDEYFETVEATTSSSTLTEETKTIVTEEPQVKIVLNTEDQKQRVGGFTDKIKEFDAFLEDFDIPIKTARPEPVNHGTPVTEEIIRPEIITRPTAYVNDGESTSVDCNERCNEELLRARSSNDYTTKSDETRVRRQIPGGSWAVSPNDPEIVEYAEKGLRKFSETYEGTNEPFLIEILEATKQVVSGMLYKIKVRLGESTCSKGSKENCQLKTDSDIKNYLITVWSQPWIDHGKPDIKVELHADQQVTRIRRSGGARGGPRQRSPTDPEIVEYANKGLRKFSETFEGTNEPILVEIIEATSQVVSGSLYKIKARLGESTCEKGKKEKCVLKADSDVKTYLITVWSQPWIDHGNPDIKVELHTDEQASRVRRSSVPVLGGPEQRSPSDPDIIEYAEKGLRKFAETYEGENEPILVEIIEATSQVVAGSLYKIKARFGESTCEKGKKETCKLKADSDIKTYLITVISQSWVDNGKPDIQVELYTDEQASRVRRSSVPVLGGPEQRSPSDHDIVDYANKGLRKFAESYEGTNEPILVEIIEATSQVVSGSLYKIKARIGESTCEKGKKEKCELKADGDIKTYLITVWSQPWVDHGNPDIKVELHTEQQVSRVRRSDTIPGGPTQKSPSDPEIVEYANKGLRKFAESYEGTNEPILVEIIEATSQVVSGSLYKIKARFGESTCEKGKKEKCELKADGDIKTYLITVWSQPWVDHGNPDIKVELHTEQQVSRVRRSDTLPGGPTQKSPSDPEIVEYANKGLRKFAESYEGTNEPMLVEIIEATSQVVSGSLYKIKARFGESTCEKGKKEKCELKADGDIKTYLITVWSQPWVDHGNPDIKVELHTEQQVSRVRRSDTIPGGPAQKSPSDPEIVEYANKGLRKFAESYKGTNEPILVEIIEATSQVVSGSLYKIKARFGESTCENGKKEKCELKADGDIKTYLITVWSQPWVDHGNPDIKVQLHTDQQVSRVRRSEPVLGGPSQISPNDPVIKEYAQKGLRKVSETNEGTAEPILIEITEATSQVVSGTLYKIKVRLGESTCQKGQKENCELKADSDVQECLISVWSQPWIDHGNPDIQVECNPVTRRKRSLRGANYSAKMLKLRENIEAERAFEKFIIEHEKSYATDEERNARFRVFQENMKIIENLRQGEQGTAEYGFTMFADLSPQEFRSKYLGLKPSLRSDNQIPFPKANIPDIKLPEEFDWRHYNVVTPVKDQGQCGSCWAFAVTGNIEGLYAIKHGKLLSLSEQELVDCDSLDDGCQGGLPDNAYRSIESLGGLELESDYPYDGKDEKCHFDKAKAKVDIVSGLNITSNETEMAQWLVKNGPISIGINANAMQFYMGGVSHPYKFLCSSDNLDHGVLIVGFGVHTYPIFKKELPYWTIKNSWGPRWGEQGYYRVYRGDGTCGLNKMASSAVLE